MMYICKTYSTYSPLYLNCNLNPNERRQRSPFLYFIPPPIFSTNSIRFSPIGAIAIPSK